MARLLQIDSCPLPPIALSSTLAQVFLKVYKEAHPSDTIEVMNLWKVDFPAAIGELLGARFAGADEHGRPVPSAEAWQMIERYAEHFKSADKFLFTIPTWSFGIPYVLKEYIDVITQPGLLIEFAPAGVVKGLVADRPACVLYARGGGAKGPGSTTEACVLQVSFMTGWLRHLGITSVRNVFDAPADLAPQRLDEALEKAENEAKAVARNL